MTLVQRSSVVISRRSSLQWEQRDWVIVWVHIFGDAPVGEDDWAGVESEE